MSPQRLLAPTALRRLLRYDGSNREETRAAARQELLRLPPGSAGVLIPPGLAETVLQLTAPTASDALTPVATIRMAAQRKALARLAFAAPGLQGVGLLLPNQGGWDSVHVSWVGDPAWSFGALIMDCERRRFGPMLDGVKELARMTARGPGGFVVRCHVGSRADGVPSEWRYGLGLAMELAQQPGRVVGPRFAAIGPQTATATMLATLPTDVRLVVRHHRAPELPAGCDWATELVLGGDQSLPSDQTPADQTPADQTPADQTVVPKTRSQRDVETPYPPSDLLKWWTM
jgi:hypothetical protein